MRVGIAGKQEGLKEKQAGGPYRGSPAKPGQDVFGEHRFDLEQKKGREKYRYRIEPHRS
jgi:hypothetical protein